MVGAFPPFEAVHTSLTSPAVHTASRSITHSPNLLLSRLPPRLFLSISQPTMASYRSDKAPSYDHTLLSSVPGPTRAEKQEGYRVDLLDESRERREPTPPNGAPSDSHGPTTTGNIPDAAGNARKEDSASSHEPVVKRAPWYRTRWGIGVIVLILFLIIGGIVGGVVAGTHHTSKKTAPTGGQSQGVPQNISASASASASPTSSQQEGSVGAAPPTKTP
ncbi:hypothetical protein BC826DRAFT_1022502 [Russula brevipes]|nr:hypothetical protein BC826DRAFT_1022502 [Russula brevipes]